ncbi:unnamed protein product (macronuclear) [Paramecium tetraurelia]|uniref:Uncharacterized protein n=1 Tax=Paramecium tetraurelia TaxID=5888 RepID=A0BDY8_PARTE|nr:uncharacterized protein GSPATT00027786001 [Paramecium tetraurelia]CAK56755.1 unnamed protein product [Paramecium tetraurelia]|eukprot:XP_001424153.1 hypothetical protein (macronuclear) [Paramecium tetraurelia strain d4-2]
MNFKQEQSLSKQKSNQKLLFRADHIQVTNPKSIPNTPTSSKHQKVNSIKRIHTVNGSEKLDKLLDLKNKRIARKQQISLDSEPKQLFRKASQLTIQSDTDLTNFIQIKTTRTTREHKFEDLPQMKTPNNQLIGCGQKQNKFQQCESQKNNNILDLLLLNTQQLKDIFQKVKEPQIRQKPKINNIKGFPSDFFSIQ